MIALTTSRLPAWLFVAALLSAAAVAAPHAGAGSPRSIRSVQELAVLLTSHDALSTPGARRSTVSTLTAWRPVTAQRTTLPVVGHATIDGARWLRVMLPGRPNGRTGWIAQQGTAPATTGWHVVVAVADRRVLVYRHGALIRSFAAVVGKPSTPTPRGRFFVEETVLLPRGSPGAPFALALSARSNVLQEFEGGPGQVAIHGVANVGGTPGTAASHGCIRLADRAIRWLAARVSPGVPVTIGS
jgi:lipoprotein-anchoring transpeptidase ErfK/SrfK